MWRKNSDEDFLKMSMSSQLEVQNQSFEQMEEEMYHLVAENRVLKSSLVEVRSIHIHIESLVGYR